MNRILILFTPYTAVVSLLNWGSSLKCDEKDSLFLESLKDLKYEDWKIQIFADGKIATKAFEDRNVEGYPKSSNQRLSKYL